MHVDFLINRNNTLAIQVKKDSETMMLFFENRHCDLVCGPLFFNPLDEKDVIGMIKQKSSLLVFDTKNEFDKNKLVTEEMELLSIKRSHISDLSEVSESQPDIVIKVINEEEEYAFEEIVTFLRKIKQTSNKTQILVVNAENNKEKIYQLIDAGVSGVYDGKNVPLEEVIRLMQLYGMYISFSYQRGLVDGVREAPVQAEKKPLSVNEKVARKYLTKREVEILEDLLENGGNYEASARRLYISPKTLKNHIASIRDKLGADNRTHIVPLAIRNGCIDRAQ